ncbi:MAG: hypothetical protein AB7N76_05445 [Planctomycetota bacterium]
MEERSYRAFGAAGGLCLAIAACFAGGFSEATLGCENTTVVAAGSPEGEIYSQHGCPDEVIGLSTAAKLDHWDKYIAIWRIEEQKRWFGALSAETRSTQIAYVVQNGKVVNGGYVAMGALKAHGQDRTAYAATRRAFPPQTHAWAARGSAGCEVTEMLAPGASEGEVVMKHGAPDRVVDLGTPATGRDTVSADRYLFEYRIAQQRTDLLGLRARSRFYNICYLIDRGRVLGGGYVGGGSRTATFGSAPPRAQLALLLGGALVLLFSLSYSFRRPLVAGGVAALYSALGLLLAAQVPASILLTVPFGLVFWRGTLEAAREEPTKPR